MTLKTFSFGIIAVLSRTGVRAFSICAVAIFLVFTTRALSRVDLTSSAVRLSNDGQHEGGRFSVKRCCRCHQIKSLEEFYVAQKSKDGKGARCKVCAREVAALRRQEPDYAARYKEYKKQWFAAHPTYQAESARNLRARKPEAYRAIYARQNATGRAAERKRQWRHSPKGSEYCSNYQKAWRAKYPEKVREAFHRRRARIKGNGGNFTASEWRTLCALYENRCLACGRKVKLTVDHVLPISKGGSNFIENIQPLCMACNDRKGVKHIDYRNK